MAVYEIPLSPSPQSFTISLGGTEYRLTIKYQNFLQDRTVIDIPQLAPGLYPQYSEMADLASFSRDSMATYIKQDGTVVKVPAGQPRFTESGLLIEQGEANTLSHSEDFADASWEKIKGGTASLPVVTRNTAIAPDGTLTADELFFDLNGGTMTSDFSRVRRPFAESTIIGQPASSSIWLKTADGTDQSVLVGFLGSATIIDVSGAWALYKSFLSSATSSSAPFNFGASGYLNGGANVTLHAWGAHALTGKETISSYIPTDTTPITRPDDVASIGHTEQANTQGGWTVDIASSNGSPIVNGVPIVTGCDLLAQYRHLGFAGELRVQTSNDPDAVPTWANLGNQSHLYWITT